MYVKFVKLLVARDPTVATILTDEPIWVVPILEEVFGQGNVLPKGEYLKQYDPPNPSDEYSRLETVYGGTGNPRVDFVEKVYGAGSRGAAELGRAIEAATVEELPATGTDPLLS